MMLNITFENRKIYVNQEVLFSCCCFVTWVGNEMKEHGTKSSVLIRLVQVSTLHSRGKQGIDGKFEIEIDFT